MGWMKGLTGLFGFLKSRDEKDLAKFGKLADTVRERPRSSLGWGAVGAMVAVVAYDLWSTGGENLEELGEMLMAVLLVS